MVPIPWSYYFLLLGGVVFGAIGYYCVVRGMRLGEASIVAPFRYSRIMFAILIGYLVFGESVDAITFFGILLIVSTGLYTFFDTACANNRTQL